ASGQVHLTFAPETTFQLALLAGGGALAVLILIAALPRKRGLAPAPGRHRFRREGLYLFGGIALIAVGGLAGVALAVAGVLAFFTTRLIGRRASQHDQVKLKRAMRVWLWLVPPGLYLFGAWLANGVKDPHGALWPQFLGLGAVVALWLSA